MKAYHIYYMLDRPGKYHEINLFANLASCILWKKHYGPIGLYCNQVFLDYLKEYDLDKQYSEINVDVLESIPYKDQLDKYWSFCKIHTIRHIASREKRFAIIDNDFYPISKHNFNWDKAFIAYHDEAFDERSEYSTYINAKHFLDESNLSQLNWNVKPINCAFMYFNNAKDLIEAWHSWSIGVIRSSLDKPKQPMNRDTMFIEQYILAALIDKVKIDWELILPVTYLHYISPFSIGLIEQLNDANHGYEWYPLIDSNPKYREIFNRFRHIWGLKRLYQEKYWRDLILGFIVTDLLHNEIDMEKIQKEYEKIVNSCLEIAQEIS